MGLIISVDPYEKYGINVFGFKTKAVMFGREVKFRMLDNTTNKYEAFLLGSSAAHRYKTSDMNEITGLKSFNYSVQHSTTEDYLAITRHIIEKQSPKLIIVQFDFYTLNKNFETDPRLYNSPLRKYLKKSQNNYFDSKAISNTYLTMDALRDSIRVIGVNLFSEPRHIYLEHGDYPKEKLNTGKVKLSQHEYGKYEFDQKRVNQLKELQELAKQNNIRLIAITTPHTYEHVQSIKSQGLEKELNQFKNILANTFSEVYDFTNEGLKPYSTSEYFMDSSHLAPKLGKLILSEIFEANKSLHIGRNISLKSELILKGVLQL
tara:strand:- start:81752 stop:82708 length:957 start_codon:yes stop_codon:yes gene_type:complete